ncbi:hypothetical protein NQ317_002199 [Molorchus minor]|uniref:CLIP domain-containing serine protease n=1 Tax=Molorchus minor TaxID=1323400 RepID=A0ABQ9JPD0_9CUCU|nr:hypothetical protein NQ317_002199 [Molorchus minor]
MPCGDLPRHMNRGHHKPLEKFWLLPFIHQEVNTVFTSSSPSEFYTTTRKSCSTPDGKSGQCIPILECQPIIDYVNAEKPLTPSVRTKLARYTCGVQDGVTKVCCPSGKIQVLTVEIPPPPDVTGHKNLHLLPEECGLIFSGNKIRNGEDAEFNEFPWMALLSYKTANGPDFQCGGTIINDHYILTAAHCVVNVSFPLISVRVGEYDLGSKVDCSEKDECLPPVQDLEIEQIIYPEDYNVTLYANDIALIRVASKIDLTRENAHPICLPILEEVRTREFNKGIVTGWGFTDPQGKTTDVLQKVTLDSRKLSICKNAYVVEPAIKLNHKQLCIGGIAKKDSCRGDSGGPFHVPLHFNEEGRYVQFGVVSIGPLYCGYEGVPGIYTKVTYYMDWILDNLKP